VKSNATPDQATSKGQVVLRWKANT